MCAKCGQTRRYWRFGDNESSCICNKEITGSSYAELLRNLVLDNNLKDHNPGSIIMSKMPLIAVKLHMVVKLTGAHLEPTLPL